MSGIFSNIGGDNPEFIESSADSAAKALKASLEAKNSADNALNAMNGAINASGTANFASDKALSYSHNAKTASDNVDTKYTLINGILSDVTVIQTNVTNMDSRVTNNKVLIDNNKIQIDAILSEIQSLKTDNIAINTDTKAVRTEVLSYKNEYIGYKNNARDWAISMVDVEPGLRGAKYYATLAQNTVTGVQTFNGRSGEIFPQVGDYTAALVGARPSNWTPSWADIPGKPYMYDVAFTGSYNNLSDKPVIVKVSDTSTWTGVNTFNGQPESGYAGININSGKVMINTTSKEIFLGSGTTSSPSNAIKINNGAMNLYRNDGSLVSIYSSSNKPSYTDLNVVSSNADQSITGSKKFLSSTGTWLLDDTGVDGFRFLCEGVGAALKPYMFSVNGGTSTQMMVVDQVNSWVNWSNFTHSFSNGILVANRIEAVGSAPIVELHKPGQVAFAIRIDDQNDFVVSQTNGLGGSINNRFRIAPEGYNIFDGQSWATQHAHGFAGQAGLNAPLTVNFGTVAGGSDYYPIIRGISVSNGYGYTTQADFGVLRLGNATWGSAIIRVASHESSDAGGIFTFNKAGDIQCNTSHVNEAYASGWFRTTGDSGWYNEKWAGGWMMQDASFIRAHGNKKIHTPNSEADALNIAGGGYFGGNINANNYFLRSDIRFKSNIIELDNYKDRFMDIKFKEYDKQLDNGDIDHEYGVIAQELEVNDSNKFMIKEAKISIDTEDTAKSVNYQSLFIMSSKLTQEQEVRINVLEKELADMKDLIKKLLGDK